MDSVIKQYLYALFNIIIEFVITNKKILGYAGYVHYVHYINEQDIYRFHLSSISTAFINQIISNDNIKDVLKMVDDDDVEYFKFDNKTLWFTLKLKK